MSVVWVLEHNDREYDMGDTYVRGIYASEEAARASVDSGNHDFDCCSVEDWFVLDRASPLEPKPVPPDPATQTGGSLIPEAFLQGLTEQALRPLPHKEVNS